MAALQFPTKGRQKPKVVYEKAMKKKKMKSISLTAKFIIGLVCGRGA